MSETAREQAASPARVQESPRVGKAGSLIRTVLGIAFEYYDFTVFAIFAPFFASQFFVKGDQVAATLSALLVFAVGFAFRPLGALFFGWYADRKGRKGAMVLAMTVTASGSLLIGLSPTHAAIGTLAAVLLAVARILQGFGHGGESAGAYSYISEVSPPQRRGLWASMIPVALMIGIFMATLLGATLTTVLDSEAMADWGWRVPFIVGALLGFFALWLRRGLTESEAFEKAKEQRDSDSTALGFFGGMWTQRSNILRVIALTSGVTVAFYTWGVNAPAYAISTQGADSHVALWAGLIAQVVYILALPLWGALSDRWGRRPNFIVFGITMAALAFPLTWVMGGEGWRITISMAIALTMISAAMSIDPAYFAELFPTRVRASGLAFPYAMGIAFFGGTAPYLHTWMADRGTEWMFTAYSILLFLVTVFAATRSPETVGKDLVDD